MTPERLKEIKDLIEHYRQYEPLGYGPGTTVPDLIDEVERLQAEVTRWQDRARLYHNHIVMMQQDREAVIQ